MSNDHDVVGGALLVRVSTSAVQRTKLDRQSGVELATAKHAEPDAVDAIRKIWPRGTINSIINVAVGFCDWNRRVATLDFSGPLRLMPALLFMEHSRRLREAKSQMADEARNIAKDDDLYQALLARCKRSRGDLYDEGLYPATAEEFRNSFVLSADYIPLLEGNEIVSRYQHALGAAADTLAASADEARQSALQDGSKQILDRFRPALQRMVEVLGSDKESRVYDSLMGSVHELINVIPVFSKLLGDSSLESWHSEISSALLPITTEQLRNADATQRKSHAQRARELLSRLDDYQAVQ